MQAVAAWVIGCLSETVLPYAPTRNESKRKHVIATIETVCVN